MRLQERRAQAQSLRQRGRRQSPHAAADHDQIVDQEILRKLPGRPGAGPVNQDRRGLPDPASMYIVGRLPPFVPRRTTSST